MFKIAIALVVLAHGIGHCMGLLQVSKVAVVNPEWHGDSWLLTGVAGTTATQAVAVIVWTAAIIGFAALAATIVGWLPNAWVQPARCRLRGGLTGRAAALPDRVSRVQHARRTCR